MSGVKTWSPCYSDARRAGLCTVIRGSFVFSYKKKKGFQKKKQILSTRTRTHTRTRPLSFFSKSEQTGLRMRAWAPWDPLAQSPLCEAPHGAVREPPAASNRRCQIQGRVVASLEDGHSRVHMRHTKPAPPQFLRKVY